MTSTLMPIRMLRWFGAALVLLMPAAHAAAQVSDHAAPAALPGFSELGEGWNDLRPGGETTCAHGDDYVFYARGADPTRLVVYLYGGGGCWDAETCDPERSIRAQSATFTYVSTIEPARHPARQSGILDLEHPDNPVAGYSMVAVPVCTGDAYLGDRDVTYTLDTEAGTTRQFTIQHRGQTNTMAVMTWIRANFEPREIIVAGSSAGALGTPFYASLLAQYYPTARVVGLGDDGGSWWSGATGAVDPGTWGIPDVLRGHPGWEGFQASMRVEHLYVTAARSAPNLKLYQFNHAHDARQRYYLELAGAEDLDVLRHIRANRRTIHEQVPEFRSFTVGGFRHTVLDHDLFYHYQSNGRRLRDWVAAIASGGPVASVDCTGDCLQPGLVYGDQDLRIVDRTIELLSAPDAWNPREAPGRCPAQAETYSLRCAAVQATSEVTGRTPVGLQDLPPALWDVIFTTIGRLGDRGMNNPLHRYNNHPQTTAADMISVLEEVQERIRARLVGDSGGEQALLDLNERILREYVVRNNTRPLEATALGDFFAATPGGIESRAHVIATVGNVDVDSVTIENTEIRFHDDAALLAGTLSPYGRLSGRPMPTLTYLSVYVRQEGRWRLAARSLTPLLASPPR
jgi:hypothetical protein